MSEIIPQYLDRVGGSWPAAWTYKWRSSHSEYEIYDLWTGTDWYSSDSSWPHSVKVLPSNSWFDHGTASPTTVDDSDVSFIKMWDGDGTNVALQFNRPTVASWITPPPEDETGTEGYDVSAKAEIIPTGGQILTSHVYLAWDNVTHLATSDFTNDVVIYHQYSVSGQWSHSRYNFTYTQSTKTWSHSSGNPSDDYFPWSLNSVDSHLTATATVYNPETLFGYTDTGGLYFKFINPWYEPPPPPPPIFVPRSARRGNLNFW